MATGASAYRNVSLSLSTVARNRFVTSNDSLMTETFNSTVELNYLCLLLIPLPIATIFGNVLVVLAVLTEQGLKTPTNFILVSLATADLLIGVIVQPFSIYLAVNNLEWHLPRAICHIFNVADVSASTASIVNLVAVSVDRFIAVIHYNEYRAMNHNRRILITVSFVWIFSVGLGLPLGAGLNQWREEEHRCEINNLDYIFYGSIFAFYIPCLIMVLMYGVVFFRLHKRMMQIKMQEMAAGHMVNFGAHLNDVVRKAHSLKDQEEIKKNALAWALPFIKSLEDDIVDEEDMSSDDLQELTTILCTLETDHKTASNAYSRSAVGEPIREEDEENLCSPPGSVAVNPKSPSFEDGARSEITRFTSFDVTDASGSLLGNQGVKNGTSRQDSGKHISFEQAVLNRSASSKRRPVKRRVKRRMVEMQRSLPKPLQRIPLGQTRHQRKGSIYVASEKVKGLKERAIKLLMKMKHKEGQQVRKESRATKLVAAVVGVFLICWLPFFTLNTIKAFRLRWSSWNPQLEFLFSIFTWLGALNSAINPVLYSLINKKFRIKFRQLLHCSNAKPKTQGYQRQLHLMPQANEIEEKTEYPHVEEAQVDFEVKNTEAKETERSVKSKSCDGLMLTITVDRASGERQQHMKLHPKSSLPLVHKEDNSFLLSVPGDQGFFSDADPSFVDYESQIFL